MAFEQNYLDVSFSVPSYLEIEELKENSLISSTQIFNEDGSYNREGLFSPSIWPKTDSCKCGHLHGSENVGFFCSDCQSEVLSAKDNDKRFGLIELATPSYGVFKNDISLVLKHILKFSQQKIDNYFNGNEVFVVVKDKDGSVLQEFDIDVFKATNLAQNFDNCEVLCCGDLIKHLLSKVDLKAAIDFVNQGLISENPDYEDFAHLSDILTGLSQKKDKFNFPLRLTDLVSSYAFVTSPSFRPLSKKGSSYELGDENEFYLRLMKDKKNFDNIGLSNAEIIQRISAKIEAQKTIDQYTQHVLTGLTSKEGTIHRFLVKQSVDGSATAAGGPGLDLKYNEVRLSRAICYSIFEPFIVAELVQSSGLTEQQAKEEIESRTDIAKSALEKIAEDRIVMFSRDPVLWEHGIFFNKVKLMDEDNSQKHNVEMSTMQCKAMNADFDGDTYRIQGIWSKEVEDMARSYMMTYPNLFNSATGKLLAFPRQDSALGLYFLTRKENTYRYGFPVMVKEIEDLSYFKRYVVNRVFYSAEKNFVNSVKVDGTEISPDKLEKGLYVKKGSKVVVTENGVEKDISKLNLSGKLKFCDSKFVFYDVSDKEMNFSNDSVALFKKGDLIPENTKLLDVPVREYSDVFSVKKDLDDMKIIENQSIVLKIGDKNITTTPGRVLFNDIWFNGKIDAQNFINEGVTSKRFVSLIENSSWTDEKDEIVRRLEAFEALGFKTAEESGLSTRLSDFVQPESIYKENFLSFNNEESVNKQLDDARAEFIAEVKKDPESSLAIIIDSGARGSWKDVSQVACGIGYIHQINGDRSEVPIKSNYLDGFSSEYLQQVFEETIARSDKSSGGAVSQVGAIAKWVKNAMLDLNIVDDDCHTTVYDNVNINNKDVLMKYLAKDVKDSQGNVIVKEGTAITEPVLKQIKENNIENVAVRSVLGCTCHHGVCKKCYGLSAKSHKEVELDYPVGLVAACNTTEEVSQNLLNVNKGNSMIALLESYKNFFRVTDDDRDNLNNVCSIEDYSFFLEKKISGFSDFCKTSGLDVSIREIELFVKQMYGKVKIQSNDIGSLKAGKEYNFSELIKEDLSLQSKDNPHNISFSPVAFGLRETICERFIRNPDSVPDTFTALMDIDNKKAPAVLAEITLSNSRNKSTVEIAR